jgi:DNA repair protein RadC
MKVKSSPPPAPYNSTPLTPPTQLTRKEEASVLKKAAEILLSRIVSDSTVTPVNSPGEFAQFLKYWFASHYDTTIERFIVIMLDSQHRVITEADVPTPYPISTGTVDSASIYPREVVKAVLRSNYPVAAVVLAHNHPSGTTEPSQADIRITNRLKDALALVDVRVLDHLIVSDTPATNGTNGTNDTNGYYSFAEKGLL